jgi:hypothetical protein
LATAFVCVLAFGAGCTCGSGPYEGDYFDGDRPEPIQDVKFVESEKGDPKIVGCADGQREGFADMTKNTRVAGCVGQWDGTKSLRDKPTGKACGDDGGKCAVPADLCAEGWSLCGQNGKGADIASRAAVNECNNAGPGRFNAAVSHSPTDEVNPCPKITKATTLPCVTAGLGSEPVCCGNDCLEGKCKDGVWRGKTKISRGTTEGCGAVTSERNGGVMCCFDGEGNPADVAAAAAQTGGAEGADETGTAGEGKAEAGEAAAEAGDVEAEDAKADEGKKDAAGGAKGDTKSAADAKKRQPKKEETKADG